jgi:hypothetical protein
MPITSNAGVYRVGAQYGVLRYQQTAIDIDQLAKDLGAAYNWSGETLPSVGSATGNWIDTINGTVATATGSPTVTTLNGRPAALFSGTQWFRTAAFAAALTQPYAQVIVARSDGEATAVRFMAGGISGGSRASVVQEVTTRQLAAYRGGSSANAVTDLLVPDATPIVVLVSGINTSPMTMTINGVGGLSNTSTAAHTLTGVAIGAAFDNTGRWIGLIARVTIFPAAAIANAATFAAACQSFYSIT